MPPLAEEVLWAVVARLLGALATLQESRNWRPQRELDPERVVVGDLPRQLVLGEAALKQRHEIEAAGTEEAEREDGTIAVLREPADLIVEVLLSGRIEDRARDVVELSRRGQARGRGRSFCGARSRL